MKVLEELDKAVAVLLGRHFVYKSGKHGSGYINPDDLLPVLPQLQDIGMEMAPEDVTPDVVLGPDFGGNYLAFQTAEAFFRKGKPAKWVATKKSGDDFVIEPDRGFEILLPGQEVWITEDLLTTGGSVAKVCRLAESHGAHVLGVCVVVNRGGVTAQDIDVPRLVAVENVSFDAIDADECPLCADAIPIVEDVGHGANYKLAHPDYPGGYISLLAA
jgi:orotate phosphoribosyltransferase